MIALRKKYYMFRNDLNKVGRYNDLREPEYIVTVAPDTSYRTAY